ncbi:MAG: hypothetical protein B6229_07230 [Spirochaetaceae bacterium 4572_7]|nr:MAG: hypothetical protein B6229_07230 [Spirochaetaceae bacterium 4572_7]
MKVFMTTLMLLFSVVLYGEDKISISTNNGKVIARIDVAPDEYITLNEFLLYLDIESEEYDFTFDGYPEGPVHDDGSVYYSESLELSGVLSLKTGVEPANYNIDVILGYQTCNTNKLCNIPVELSQTILVKQNSSEDKFLFLKIGLVLAFIASNIVILSRRKKKNIG